MAGALAKLGFDVVEGRDLDKRSMERTIRQFGIKLAGADVALFFYAGHGMQVGGQNYLVPTDARLAGEAGVKIVISSDAHELAALANLEFGVAQARRGWLGPEQILNTRPWGSVKKLLKT